MLTHESSRVFESRKQDHMRLALDPRTQATGTAGFDRVVLEHDALPEMNFEEVKLNTRVLGSHWNIPVFVSSMTAGHSEGHRINEMLFHACKARGWAMGVGSQRKQLADPVADAEWSAFRGAGADVFLMGNIGLSQLIQMPVESLQRLVDTLEAKAMIVHTNPLQECMQPEGTPHFRGGLKAIERAVKALPVPLVLKETGCGFSKSTLMKLKGIGLAAVDVAGLGGTHWGRIEGLRAEESDIRRQAAETFEMWGIGTIESVLNAQSITPDFEIWGSGGVRSGLDAAKLLALGCQAVGVAQPILKAAMLGEEALHKAMETLEYELKVALFCTGSKNLNELTSRKKWQLT